ncbi:MAG: Cell division protein FtsA [Phycisphaerae bacterium]|nr:Cell division protein FtsA [Phycisphaerae bacterium]
MAKAKSVWGIDVGHCALKAIKLTRTPDGELEVAALDYIEHAKILSQPDANPPELIAESLEKFLSRNDITQDGVALGVPGQHTLARFSKLPPVDPKKIPDIVRFEANQQIPFDIDEVVWDYQTFSEPDSPEIEVGIFAMKRELLHEHLAHFTDAGIEPILVQASPLAAYDAMYVDDHLGQETSVLVDIGADNTDLLFTDRVRIWTRTLPIGGNTFTDALATGFKLSFSKAENLKRQAASSKYARQIFQTMRPIFADLVSEIQRSIGFYTSTHRDAKIERLIGLGDAFKLPGLLKYLQQNLDLPVVRPELFSKVKWASGVNKDEEHELAFAVAYGLAAAGLGHGMMKNNLLPPEVARQVLWRKKKPWFAATAACVLLSAGLVWYRYSADMGTLGGSNEAANTTVSLSEADNIFKNGLPRSMNPREYSYKVAKTAEVFKSEQGRLANEGQEEKQELDDILSLLELKVLYPAIMDAVHQALPPPPTQLATTTSGVEYVDQIIKAGELLERAKREEIFIDRYSSQFSDNVLAEDYRPEGMDDGPLFDFYSEQGAEGFIITLYCRTPNQDKGKFVDKPGGFIQNLKLSGQQPDQGFYFDGVRLISGASKGGSSSAKPAGGLPVGGKPAGGAPEGGGAGSGTSLGGRDPLTLEEIKEDWEFVVKLAVVIGELPKDKTPGTPAKSGRRPTGGGNR